VPVLPAYPALISSVVGTTYAAALPTPHPPCHAKSPLTDARFRLQHARSYRRTRSATRPWLCSVVLVEIAITETADESPRKQPGRIVSEERSEVLASLLSLQVAEGVPCFRSCSLCSDDCFSPFFPPAVFHKVRHRHSPDRSIQLHWLRFAYFLNWMNPYSRVLSSCALVPLRPSWVCSFPPRVGTASAKIPAPWRAALPSSLLCVNALLCPFEVSVSSPHFSKAEK
jgi:hypothetical protein